MRARVMAVGCLLSFACASPSRQPGADAGPVSTTGPDAGPAAPDAGASDAGPADGGQAGGADAGVGFAHRPTQIAAENKLPGSNGWHLADPSGQIAAYTDRTSAFPGEQVSIHAAASSATSATWQLWRFGYYHGEGGRELASGGPVAVPAWSAPVLDTKLGSVSANYPVVFSFAVPGDAVTGVYLVKVSASLGDTWAMFVVKDPIPGAAILYQVATNTYQAYNQWGGTSLYANHRSDWSPWHAYAVTFDRPYQNNGAGEAMSMDRGLITFVEAQGYDVSYVSDADVDADPSLTANRRMVLYPAHTEYWTANMRQGARSAIDSGEDVAFMGANSAYWQVRYADDTRRLMIGYKEFCSLDPDRSSDPAHSTCRWRDPPLDLPENAMEGAMFGSWTWGSAPYTVTDPNAWLWAGAGVQAGSIISGVYGDETDRRYDNGLTPAGISVFANGFVEDHNAHFDYAESTLYPTAAGGLVFDAGSITFSRGLGETGRWDPRIQQLAANLFSRFAGDGTVPANVAPMILPAGLPTPTWRAGVQVSTVTSALEMPTAVAAAADGSAIVADADRIVRVSPAGQVTIVAGSTDGFADGPAAQALFSGPRGVAVAADGTIYVSDTGNHRIRAIANGFVTTIAGSTQGFADGSSPLFSQPMGIALTATGTLLVADTWNMRVRELTPQGVASTWAGSGAEGIEDGAGTQAQLNFPMGIAILPSGNAVIVEPGAGVLREVTAAAPHQVFAIAGYPGDEGWQDGPTSSANVLETVAVGVAKDGEILLVDQATSRIRAIKNGVIDTLAGGRRGGTFDGAGAGAGFAAPRAVAGAPDGSIFVVDAREHTLRRITLP